MVKELRSWKAALKNLINSEQSAEFCVQCSTRRSRSRVERDAVR